MNQYIEEKLQIVSPLLERLRSSEFSTKNRVVRIQLVDKIEGWIEQALKETVREVLGEAKIDMVWSDSPEPIPTEQAYNDAVKKQHSKIRQILDNL